MVNVKKEEQIIEVKIGNISIPIKVRPGDEMYYQLVANKVNEKYRAIKETNPDTIQSYALTAFEFATGDVEISHKLNEKIGKIEDSVAKLVDQLDSVLQDYK
ncbi:MAG: cell division protein ZapA [Endomicrobiia bacterium]